MKTFWNYKSNLKELKNTTTKHAFTIYGKATHLTNIYMHINIVKVSSVELAMLERENGKKGRWEMAKSRAKGNKNFFYFSIFNEGVLCQCINIEIEVKAE